MKTILIEIILSFIFCLDFVRNDCKLPAIPYNSRIDKVKHNYQENETVNYQCDLNLFHIGPKERVCRNGQWTGAIPKCFEEVNPKNIKSIEFEDSDNQTLAYEGTDIPLGISQARDPNKCLHLLKNFSKPITLRLNLNETERHITDIELTLLDTNDYKKNYIKKIKSINVNAGRKCIKKELTINFVKNHTFVDIGITCAMEFNNSGHVEQWKKDQTNAIDIIFNAEDFAVCGIRIFKKSEKPYHWCGSADIVPHSSRYFRIPNVKGNFHYRYRCSEGFELGGKQDVNCGMDNYWTEKFPTCEPVTACPYPPSNHSSAIPDISAEHLFTKDGKVGAVVGSVVWYTCAEKYKSVRSSMIGNSVRVCDSEGEWTGVDPICIYNYQIMELIEYIQDIDKNEDLVTDFEAFNKIIKESEQDELACGIPAMPVHAKPITHPDKINLTRHADLRHSYPNGTVIGYQCESANWEFLSEQSERTCRSGKWVGKVEKCAINWADRTRLDSIHVYYWDDHDQLINDYIERFDNYTGGDPTQKFAFSGNFEAGSCPTFQVNRKQRWSLLLNRTERITKFIVELHHGFLGTKGKITDRILLDKIPIAAKFDLDQCLLESYWESENPNSGTSLTFVCDLDEPQNDSDYHYSRIDLEIDPAKFGQDKKSRNISFCSLQLFGSDSDCGTPDIPLHSSAIYSPQTRTWNFTCDEGYELIGWPIVRCGRNGRWIGDFQLCLKREVCPLMDQKYKYSALLQYTNQMYIDDQKVSEIDPCISTNISKRVWVGPRVRICTKNGQWSGTDPFCYDLKNVRQIDSRSQLITFGAVIGVILVLFFITISMVTICRRKRNKDKMKEIDNTVNYPL